MKYICNVVVYSRQHNRHFEAGEIIEFAPNPTIPEGEEVPAGVIIVDIDGLVSGGVLTPLPEPPAKSKKE